MKRWIVHLYKCSYCITIKQYTPLLLGATSEVHERLSRCPQFGGGRRVDEPPLREINFNARLVVDASSDTLKSHYDLGQASQHSGRKLTDSE